ncbi:MAG: leucine-rich repeat domain-containing protein [Mycoplasmataceae bacterium]|nr:leucine-rich repeat domain-containing protein [Mycoplasmataceae bacterium]
MSKQHKLLSLLGFVSIIGGGSALSVLATSCGPNTQPPLETGVQLWADGTSLNIGSAEDYILLSVKLWNFDADPTASGTFQWNHTDTMSDDIFDIAYSSEITENNSDGLYYFQCYLNPSWEDPQPNVALMCTVNGKVSNPVDIDVYEEPAPAYELNITSTNFSTYFDGTFPALGAAKNALGQYLSSSVGLSVNKINFTGITSIQDTDIFYDCDYISASNGQIKHLNFEGSDLSFINNNNFRDCLALEDFYVRSTQGLTVGESAFKDSTNLSIFSLDGTFEPIKQQAFQGCSKLHSIYATQFTIPADPQFPAFGANAFQYTGSVGEVTGGDAYGIDAPAWVARCKLQSNMSSNWVGHSS